MVVKCDKCGKEFDKKFNLDRHLKRKYPCDKNQKTEGTENNIKNEEKIILNKIETENITENKKETECKYCGKTMLVKNLRKHYREICDNIPENKRKFYIEKLKKDKRHKNEENDIDKNKEKMKKEILIELKEELKREREIMKQELLLELKQIHNLSDIKTPKPTRKTIPKSVKDKLWDDTFGHHSGIGKCYVCEKEINSKRFDCGHIKAVVDGGTNALNNLKPICSTCNSSMGSTNLEDFKKEYFSKITI